MKIESQSPLKWPQAWPRTRISDRETRPSWKKSFSDYREVLAKELARMGVTEMLLTYNAPGQDRMDCGVAVYFSRTPRKAFAWQDALGLLTPAPTLEEIDVAFRRRAMEHHPDRGGVTR